ncbi:hypothetical protein A9Z42_0028670 [Trichoderma parareesei]|uniref:Bromo domain-containing protein n=1 Tax=Trichoderma parareesei TaxID=858221 RepID=A0A2H2Z8H2_TRIPA|nr:hypothetical protein A9Z42_0028670 [Trichoderma parareesei]
MNHQQPAAFTPLESLFLFQSLLSQGVDGGAFARISELLRGNPLIKSGETYDAARLTPEALQQQFLGLLRDELKGVDAERTDGGQTTAAAAAGGGGDGTGSPPGSLKRKLGSQAVPTLKDIYDNLDVLPTIIDRLYARYRDHMVGLIREDERRLAVLQREIQLLERSEKERLAKVAASQNVTPTQAPRDPRTAATAAVPTTASGVPSVAAPSPLPPTNGATPPTPSPTQTPATAPPAIRKGPTPNTPVPPPKPPVSAVAAPKVPVQSQLAPATTPSRPATSPKPPHAASSVLQAPAGAPTPQPGIQVLQPPTQQPPNQSIPPRPESAAAPQPPAAPGAAPAQAGSLKWEKPYQPPPATQAPSAEQQFSPPLPSTPSNAGLQQAHPAAQQQQPPPSPAQQQQQQWQRQPVPHPQQHPQHPQQPQQPPQQQHVPYPTHPPQSPHGQVAHLPRPQPQLQTQPQQQQQQQQQQQPQPRPPPTKSVLVPPQPAGQLAAPIQPGTPRATAPGATQQARPPSTTPGSGRPIQPQQQPQPHPQQQQQSQQTAAQHQHIQRAVQAQPSLLAQKFQHIPRIQTPRPIASANSPKGSPSVTAAGSPVANKGATPGAAATQRWQPGASQAQQGAPPRPAPSPSLATKDKPQGIPYGAQAPRPAIPEHMIRQAAATPGPVRRLSPASPAPRTPAPSSPVSLKRGFGTKWASHSTPSTPGPIASEPESPAYEPVSPPLQRPTLAKDSAVKAVPKMAVSKPAATVEANPPAKAPRGRPPRSVQRSRGPSATPSATGTRRSQSVISQTDELSLDHSMTKVKKEAAATPRLREETGDTTADESMPGRGMMGTPSSMTRASKRKRQDTPTDLQGPPTHVLWTRGFTKVSSSALDQISSHRDANMFATALREKDAPNYRQIVLQPQDITSIRAAIKAGNKAALQAAANLPGGDPGTASVWLPISDDLVPPRGIINSAHLERELVHMFCNAIMYNPDPDRGPGPAFMRRSQSDEEEVVGYRLDENGVVKNTQSMFLEVEKLLGDLRAAEKDRGIPPISTTRQGSVATPTAVAAAEDTAEEEDELAGDGDSTSASGTTAKRRRISTRI